jgi:hypothetical protein
MAEELDSPLAGGGAGVLVGGSVPMAGAAVDIDKLYGTPVGRVGHDKVAKEASTNRQPVGVFVCTWYVLA